MAGSSFGTIFKVTTWGESHGPALGAVVDGCPAGLPLAETDFEASGQFSTRRRETDTVEILSGVYRGMTTGTPISLLIRNCDQHSSDYDELADLYRPGHADFGFDMKYGFRDHRGGGRSSGRETAARTAAGAVALKALQQLGITFDTRVTSIGGVPFEDKDKVDALMESCRSSCDSIGSEAECIIRGVPAGQVDRILSLARTKDVMPQIVVPDADVIQASQMERLEHYNMGVYRPMYEKAMTLVPDIYAFAASCTDPFLKRFLRSSLASASKVISSFAYSPS